MRHLVSPVVSWAKGRLEGVPAALRSAEQRQMSYGPQPAQGMFRVVEIWIAGGCCRRRRQWGMMDDANKLHGEDIAAPFTNHILARSDLEGRGVMIS